MSVAAFHERPNKNFLQIRNLLATEYLNASPAISRLAPLAKVSRLMLGQGVPWSRGLPIWGTYLLGVDPSVCATPCLE